MIGDKLLATGTGRSKKEAEQAAARLALEGPLNGDAQSSVPPAPERD